MTIGPEARYQVPPRVLSRQAGGEAVLLDLDSDQYYALNEVGTAVFGLLSEGASFGAIIDALTARYDVAESQLASDVTSLLADLEGLGLVKRDAL
jgi:hypothetical protein